MTEISESVLEVAIAGQVFEEMLVRKGKEKKKTLVTLTL